MRGYEVTSPNEKGDVMLDVAGSVYSYVYLPKYVKPWALSCLEHLDGSEATKFIKHEVKHYNDYGIISDFKFKVNRHQLWCFYVDNNLLGVCLTSRVCLKNEDKAIECVSKENKNLITYFTKHKETVWVVCQCYDAKGIKFDNWPDTAILESDAISIASYSKEYDDLIEFQNSTKDDFNFEEIEYV